VGGGEQPSHGYKAMAETRQQAKLKAIKQGKYACRYCAPASPGNCHGMAGPGRQPPGGEGRTYPRPK
jgi:hypothetical protein